MEKGKDVYLEKPHVPHRRGSQATLLCRPDEETHSPGWSQTTSADQWHKAKKAIADGMIGPMLMSQGSYHRNSKEGEWELEDRPRCRPEWKSDNFIDWKCFWVRLSCALDPDRYFRFRKYWDYSVDRYGSLLPRRGAAEYLLATAQFPYKVMAAGGPMYSKTEKCPIPFHLLAEYSQGHSLVLSSSMANSKHIPGLIRGHEGSIIMVDHGMFEGRTDYITVIPEKRVMSDAYRQKFGEDEIKIRWKPSRAGRTWRTSWIACALGEACSGR